jgi:CheY-like chemotaxis protein
MAKNLRVSNILVVDDYDGLRQAMSDALAELGYVVWTAECGRDALDLFSRTGDPLRPDRLCPGAGRHVGPRARPAGARPAPRCPGVVHVLAGRPRERPPCAGEAVLAGAPRVDRAAHPVAARCGRAARVSGRGGSRAMVQRIADGAQDPDLGPRRGRAPRVSGIRPCWTTHANTRRRHRHARARARHGAP